MFEVKIADYLRAFPGLKAITSNIYAISLPRTLVPALRVVLITEEADQDYEGVTDDNVGYFQVDIWSADASELSLLVREFRKALNEINSISFGVFDVRQKPAYDPDESVYKRTFEFTINYTE